jgi:hypothetical protein
MNTEHAVKQCIKIGNRKIEEDLPPVALEAAMIMKLLITFGDWPSNLLPDSMVRLCSDPRHIKSIIRNMRVIIESGV